MKKQFRIAGTVLISILFFSVQAQPALTPSVVDSSQQIADKIVNSKVPVLIDFWAAWCAPCRMLNPIISELEKEYKGKVLFMKVNVDIHKSIASYFGISGIPAVFIVNDKTVVKSLPGLQHKSAYKAALDEVLTSPPASEKPAK